MLRYQKKQMKVFRMQQIQEKLNSKSIAGLSLSLVIPLIYTLFVGPVFLKPIANEQTYNLIGFGVFWMLAFSILIFTLKIEKKPLITIGWQRLPWKWILAAIGIGFLLSLLVPVFTLLVSMIMTSPQAGSIAEVASSTPWWIILISAITAGVTEEILFRGYPLERLIVGIKNRWASACISLVFFLSIHMVGWNLTHIIGVVLPLGIALTGLYMWRRNLLFVMIIHIMINLPFVFMALLT